MLQKLKKRFRKDEGPMIIFHGTDRKLEPDEFNYDYADEDSDFGKAMYYCLSVKMARRWAKNKKNGIVNWYLFNPRDALNDDEIEVKILDDPMEWLNTILLIHDKLYFGKADIIIGDTMDARTGRLMEHYGDIANSLGIPMSELSEDTKRQMIRELNPDHFGQQLAFRSRKALSHVKFMGSMEVSKMDDSWDNDPGEKATMVAELIAERYNISQNDAVMSFLQSGTFRRLISEEHMSSLTAEEILEIYRSEVKKNGH